MIKLGPENTLLGRVELHLNKLTAITRGWHGSRLNLELKDIPVGHQKTLVYKALGRMIKTQVANNLPVEIKSLVQEVHIAIAAPCLRERHLHLTRASKILRESPDLSIALRAKYNPIDHISDREEQILMCRQELNLAVKHIDTMLDNCRYRSLSGPPRVATDLKKAHGAILSAWSFLGIADNR
jgi:hypothetical protein